VGFLGKRGFSIGFSLFLGKKDFNLRKRGFLWKMNEYETYEGRKGKLVNIGMNGNDGS